MSGKPQLPAMASPRLQRNLETWEVTYLRAVTALGSCYPIPALTLPFLEPCACYKLMSRRAFTGKLDLFAVPSSFSAEGSGAGVRPWRMVATERKQLLLRSWGQWGDGNKYNTGGNTQLDPGKNEGKEVCLEGRLSQHWALV